MAPREVAPICLCLGKYGPTRIEDRSRVLTVETAEPTNHIMKRITSETVSPANVDTQPYSAVLTMTLILSSSGGVGE